MFSISRTKAVAVGIFSILVTVLHHAYSESIDDLYSTNYDGQKLLVPPAISGPILRLFAKSIATPLLGDSTNRALLELNKIKEVVDLAEAIQCDDSDNPNGKEFFVGAAPLIRLTETEYQWHIDAAAAEDTASAARLQEYQDDLAMNPPTSRRYNTIYDYYTAYQSGSTTPLTVLTKLVDFINNQDQTLHAVETLDKGVAIQAATLSTERWQSGTPIGIWDGVPVLVKAQISIKGLPLTLGRQKSSVHVSISNTDDLIIRRFREAGAIVVGTTVMHELGVQTTGYNPWYNGPLNPYDLDRFPGGSSSGSGVVVATNMVPIAVGFDSGGSIRVPASFTGTVGLAVSYGRIPYTNGFENAVTVTKSGVLAASINDAIESLVLLGAQMTTDENRNEHPYFVSYGGTGPPPPHSKPRWTDSTPPVRIGVFWDWTKDGTTEDVFNAFSDTVAQLTNQAGYELVEYAIPQMHSQAFTHVLLVTALFTSVYISDVDSSIWTATKDDDFQPATEVQIKLGTVLKAVELLSLYRIRNFALAQWRSVLLEQVDVILTPTTPMTAMNRKIFSDKTGVLDQQLIFDMVRFLWPGNLAGLAGLAVPVGADSDGLPVSVQVICSHWREADCLAVGKDIEVNRQSMRPLPPEKYFANLLE